MEEFEEFEDQAPIQNDESQMFAVKDKLARANWKSIKENGIHTPSSLDEIKTLQGIINETINYFEDLEEYEKCADLKLELDRL